MVVTTARGRARANRVGRANDALSSDVRQATCAGIARLARALLPDTSNPPRTRAIPHGNTEEEHAQKDEPTEVREGSRQACGERHEKAEEGHAAERQGWKGGKGEEPQAGDRNRTFRGAKEGRQGAVQTEVIVEAKIASREKRS